MTNRVEIGMGQYYVGAPNQELFTRGLGTCIGVTVWGLCDDSYAGRNKGMAHASPSSDAVNSVIGGLIHAVQSSGMTVYGYCLSQADPSLNYSLTDAQLMEEFEGVVPADQLTPEFFNNYRQTSYYNIQHANTLASQWCQSLGVHGATITRSKANYFRGWPYNSMQATASPGGEVRVDGSKRADIPDPISGAAGSSGHGLSSKRGGSGNSGGGSNPGGSSTTSKRSGGGLGSSNNTTKGSSSTSRVTSSYTGGGGGTTGKTTGHSTTSVSSATRSTTTSGTGGSNTARKTATSGTSSTASRMTTTHQQKKRY
ncbi:hypothetical protein C8A03DRAFT_38822 [Achaetomium macrosporum]|uniref:Uncharacterized protein n=1 Tax=Achaetomium macrosporum TaxID=79813 RepID=A0AAN7H6Z1_9PEZI|nr:hypothetical protein C8A03DRAFT_38822 [Achaetomium macrosporum]